jgi:hypothetical protein
MAQYPNSTAGGGLWTLEKQRVFAMGGNFPSLSAFESIATTTVDVGGTGTITFSNIPQTYAHLQIRSIARNVSGGGTADTQAAMRFNGDAGANYTFHQLYGTGASAGAGSGTAQTNATAGFVAGSASTANCFSASICDILDYTNTNKNKVVRLIGGDDYGNTSGNVYVWSNLWVNTSAITSIVITNSNNFAQYSHFALYGIRI